MISLKIISLNAQINKYLSKHIYFVPFFIAILFSIKCHSILVLGECIASYFVPLLDGIILKIKLFL